MNTYKRAPRTVYDKTVKNYNKFFNQLQFKGIKRNVNIFEADPESFTDAKNMFVNYEDLLVSRDPLKLDAEFPTAVVPEGYELIEAVRAGQYTVYVSKTLEEPTLYNVTIDGTPDLTLSQLSSYHIATIQHYVICFNEKGARVFDVNDASKGWQNLTDLAEVPITKRVVGGVTTTYPNNGFTGAYKEQYIWSNESQPILPENETAEVELSTSKKVIEWTIPNTNVLTDYRILRPLDIVLEDDDLFSTARGIVCIGREDYFLLSYDNGKTFEREWYPDHGPFLKVASISKDGQYFFFAAKDAVYRCNLSDKSWTKIEYLDGGVAGQDFGNTPGTNNICYFLTGDVWCFVTFNGTDATIYWQGPGLFIVSAPFNGLAANTLLKNTITVADRSRVELDCDRERFVMALDTTGKKTVIAGAFPSVTAGQQCIFTITGDGSTIASTHSFTFSGLHSVIKTGYFLEKRETTGRKAVGSGVQGLVYRNGGWYEFTCESGLEEVPNPNPEAAGGFIWVGFEDITYGDTPLPVTSTAGYPYKLSGGWIDDLMVYDRDATVSARLPQEITSRGIIWTVGDKFYIQSGSTVYTNDLTDDDIATLTYLYNAEVGPGGEAIYTKVPDVTYADTELYMAFGNLLQITANKYDGTDIEFNLPSINDNSFISPISAMVNISTTEVALFFENKVMICSKVADETYGYRYDYYNTKLTLGTRRGDDVINTLEGTYTVFPTLRGMAFMNYQEFMATTDQVVEYITDQIKDIWTAFYKASSRIRMVQWLSHIIVTNGTRQILLFDLRTASWWVWEVPLNVYMMTTDQVRLRLISGQQYIFEEDDRYWDFPRTDHQVRIEWMAQSQPLHMNAPNYYKNIKQLIFQLVETTDKQMTIMAQIKLYRKKVTVREPEVVAFKIDELRTFVKRFNYWKINELQWGLASDPETVTPAKLILSGVTVKYEYGEEVR